MRVAINVVHECTFSVQYFEATEGGMDTRIFGDPCNGLPQALHTLELARASAGKHDWVIVVEVTTIVNEGKKP